LNKIISTKKINVIFLATMLIVGTFALMSPSFMNSAQAEPGYDKPQQYPSYKPDYNYKSKDTIGIKKVNCNNVNLNVNDVSVNNNVGRPPVGDFTTLDTPSSETESQGITANNFANGEKPNNGFKKDKDGFVYVCINNNNNRGADDDDDNGNGPTPEECTAFVACFNNPEFSEPANQIVITLERIVDELSIKGVPGFPDGYVIDDTVLTPQDLCEWLLNTPQSNGQVVTTQEQLDTIIDALAGSSSIGGFIECLGESVGFLPPSEP
jgi:hypothetical protein